MYHKRWFFLLICMLLAATFACNIPFQGTQPEIPTSTVEKEGLPEGNTAEPSSPEDTKPPAEPVQPPTEAPTATTAPEPANLCAHPYYPIKLGDKRAYRSTSDAEVAEYSIEVIAVDEDSFTVHQEYEQYTNDVTWTCTENGIVSGGENLLNFSGMDITTDDFMVQGETLPKAELWETGYAWQQTTTITGTISEEGDQYPIILSLHFDKRITGKEPVSVPAGDYQNAFRVESTVTANYQILVPDLAMPPISFTFATTEWYVQDVGLVKMEMTGDTFSEITELLSYETR